MLKLKVVIKVAKNLLPEFKSVFERVKKAANEGKEAFWLCQHFYNYFSTNLDIIAEYTRFFVKKSEIAKYKEQLSSPKNINNFILWVYEILNSDNSKNAYLQLLLIREFGNFFMRPYSHLPQFSSLNDGKGLLFIPDGVGETTYKLKMNELWYASRKNMPTNNVEHSRVSADQHIERAKPTFQFGIFASESDKVPCYLQKYISKVAIHLPGKNLWRVTTTSEFANQARYNLDMPLVSSQSGSIALLLIPAIVMGKLTAEELVYFNLNAVSYMIGNGHHSFHEFKTAWRTFKIHYSDGDYRVFSRKE